MRQELNTLLFVIILPLKKVCFSDLQGMINNTELKTYLRVFMLYTCTVGMKTGRRMSGNGR